MSKEQIELQAQLSELAKNLLQEKVDIYLKDKSNSLEDRWEVWTKYSQTNSGDWIHHFPEDKFPKLDKSINNGEWRGRGSIIKYDEIIEIYYDDLGEETFKNNWVGTNKQHKELESHPKLTELKEYLIDQNLRSYKFDW